LNPDSWYITLRKYYKHSEPQFPYI
jgi:hypothetical protein